jgi:hypothetical protein
VLSTVLKLDFITANVFIGVAFAGPKFFSTKDRIGFQCKHQQRNRKKLYEGVLHSENWEALKKHVTVVRPYKDQLTT